MLKTSILVPPSQATSNPPLATNLPDTALTFSSSSPVSPPIPTKHPLSDTRPQSKTYLPTELNVSATGSPIITLADNVVIFFANDNHFIFYNTTLGEGNWLWLWKSNRTVPEETCGDGSLCKLIFEADGNLVNYVNGKVMWTTETAGRGRRLNFMNRTPWVAIEEEAGVVVWGGKEVVVGGGGFSSTSTSSSSSSLSTPNPTTLPPVFTKVGCISDNAERTLKNYTLISEFMTTSLCSSTCHKYKFFGTENGSQCWCGDKQWEYSAPSKGPENDCSMPCNGNKEEICGGFWWMSMYMHE